MIAMPAPPPPPPKLPQRIRTSKPIVVELGEVDVVLPSYAAVPLLEDTIVDEQPKQVAQPAMADVAGILGSLVAVVSKLSNRLDNQPQQQQALSPIGNPSAMPDAAHLSMMQTAINNARPKGTQFMLHVVPEDGHPRLEVFELLEELVARIKELLGVNCYLQPAIGLPMRITKGPHRYLKTAYGALPLFDVSPDAGDETPFGWVGDQPIDT